MKRDGRIIVLLVTGCLWMGACGRQETPQAATPRDALRNMREAVIAGDTQAFIACFS